MANGKNKSIDIECVIKLCVKINKVAFGYCTFLGKNLLSWFAVYDCLTFFFFSFLRPIGFLDISITRIFPKLIFKGK